MASMQDSAHDSIQDSAARAPRRIAPPRFAPARLALAASLLALAGCSSGPYPSLGRWSADKAGNQPAPTPLPPPPTSAGAQTCDAPAADKIDGEFRDALPAAEATLKAVGKAEPGSPAWSKGNIALAGLQAIRARLNQVLAPAEEAYVADTQAHAQVDARDGLAARPEGAALAACHSHIDSLANLEDQAIDRLHGLLQD